jgi:hypothetical protein
MVLQKKVQFDRENPLSSPDESTGMGKRLLALSLLLLAGCTSNMNDWLHVPHASLSNIFLAQLSRMVTQGSAARLKRTKSE